MSFGKELEDFEEIARATRRKIGMEFVERPQMTTVIFKFMQLGMIEGYRRIADSEMPDDLGLYDPNSKILYLPERTFIAANEVSCIHPDNPRARFTIAHELGHVVLGHKQTRHRNTSNKLIEKIAPTIRRDEREAHSFAAAFLAPIYLAGNPLLSHPKDIAEKFGLSAQAAKIRLEELQRLYRRANAILRPLPPSIVEFLEKSKNKNHNSR